MKKDQIVGIYEGLVVDETEGDYILELNDVEGQKKWVDADTARTWRVSIFGKMNEDLHEGRFNAEIGEEGLIRLTKDCRNEELFTKYGDKYNWDSVKQKALLGAIYKIPHCE